MVAERHVLLVGGGRLVCAPLPSASMLERGGEKVREPKQAPSTWNREHDDAWL
eukprot:gene9641-20162_t